MPPDSIDGKICYVQIPALDLERSANFYAKVFGWNLKKRGDGTTAFDDTTGQVSGTWVLGRPVSAEPGMLIYIMVNSLTDAMDSVTRNGGEVLPAVDEAEREFIAKFRDPAGNLLGLYQEPGR